MRPRSIDRSADGSARDVCTYACRVGAGENGAAAGGGVVPRAARGMHLQERVPSHDLVAGSRLARCHTAGCVGFAGSVAVRCMLRAALSESATHCTVPARVTRRHRWRCGCVEAWRWRDRSQHAKGTGSWMENHRPLPTDIDVFLVGAWPAGPFQC